MMVTTRMPLQVGWAVLLGAVLTGSTGAALLVMVVYGMSRTVAVAVAIAARPQAVSDTCTRINARTRVVGQIVAVAAIALGGLPVLAAIVGR
jgi:hypothetical protein